MSRKKYDHIHQYSRLAPEASVYRCIIPTCPHSISRAMLVGRNAQCPDCLLTFTITYEHLVRSRVVCGCKSRDKKVGSTPKNTAIDDLLAQAIGLKRKEDDDKTKGIRESTPETTPTS